MAIHDTLLIEYQKIMFDENMLTIKHKQDQHKHQLKLILHYFLKFKKYLKKFQIIKQTD